MEIKLHTIKIRELVEGFINNDEEGVIGYNGRLNIRPKYQREFVYNEKQQIEVIKSIFKNFPLNVMYWVKNEDGTFELLDGQQRTLSICAYKEGEFFVEVDGTLRGFSNLTEEQKSKFLEYQLQIYICENGTDIEKLDWFEIINISGEQLTPQELRNAVYAGQWVTEMKKKFSKTGCVAQKLGSDYFQTVIGWICDNKTDEAIRKYMAQHQHDGNADVEWQYFQEVIAWVRRIFPKYRKEMKGLDWGLLYNKFRNNKYSSTELEDKINVLMIDDDVTNKKGVYPYLLSNEEKYLSIRAFTPKMKTQAYTKQKGICNICKNHFTIDEMEADHITPWCEGGPTTAENCQMLCKKCNRQKSNH